MMLPFRLSRLFGIVIEIQGMAIVNQEGIRLAFQDADHENRHFLDGDVQSVLISWDNLADFACDRGMLSDEVRLRVESIDQLSQLPGIQDHELSLEIRKSDRDKLKDFEQAVIEYRAGRRQDNVDEMLDDIRDFLHGL
jgi:hypothetical protein